MYIHVAIGDLVDVTDYLLHLGQTDIHNLGLVLGLSHPRLKYMSYSNTFIYDMMAAWLQKEDQVMKRGVPTWKTLVKALRHPRGNLTGVADRIETEKLNVSQELTGKNQQRLKLCNLSDNN